MNELNLNYKNIMNCFYDKDEEKLVEVANLIFSNSIDLKDFSDIISDELKLSYKQKFLLNSKMMIIADIIIIIINNLGDDIADRWDQYSEDIIINKEFFNN